MSPNMGCLRDGKRIQAQNSDLCSVSPVSL